MADLYSQRNRAYNDPSPTLPPPSTNAYIRQNRPPQPPALRTRTLANDNQDDAYGDSSVTRRQSHITTPFSDDQFYDLYAASPVLHRRSDSDRTVMADRAPSPVGGFFNNTGQQLP